jgi:hypothetical protein
MDQRFPDPHFVGYGDVSRELKALAQLPDLKVV